jgi:hypothetical protein
MPSHIAAPPSASHITTNKTAHSGHGGLRDTRTTSIFIAASVLLVVAHYRTGACENHNENPDAYPDYRKYDAYHPADSACLRHPAPQWVHNPCIHFPQVFIAHHPRDDAADSADHDAKYSKDQDDCAAVGF